MMLRMKTLSLKNSAWAPCLVLLLGLSGCAPLLTQSPSAPPAPPPTPAVATVPAAGRMNLEIAGSATLNPDASGTPQQVVLRVYQLKSSRAFETATYAQLLDGDDTLLGADLVSHTEATLAPGTTLRLSEPLQGAARFVGVVAFFRNQDDAEWQIVIPKSQWRRTDPVRLTVDDNRLELDAGGARSGRAPALPQ
jgi:type VI secretion system protein VasD